MSYTTFLNDTVAVRERGEWWIECYTLNSLGVETILRFSLRGYGTGSSAITVGSDTIAAHTPFVKRVIDLPVITQSLWKQANILSSSFPSFGGFKLTNVNGGLDQYSPDNGYTWEGKRCKVYFLDYRDIANTIGKVFDGNMGTVEFNLENVTIPLLGREQLFQVPLSTRVYRGTSYMLELFGDRTVSYGTPAPLDITGSLTLESWLWLEALPTAEMVYWGWFSGTRSPWRLGIRATGEIRIYAHIAGTQEIITSSMVLSALKPYHISVVISGRNVTFYVWDDDNQTLSTNIQVNAFSSSTRNANVGGTFTVRTGTDATFKPWWDESRVWNVARTALEIESDRFRPLTTVPVTCVHRIGFDDGTGTTVTDSSASAAHGTISGAGTSTWLWAHEGGTELAGTPKQDVWGEKWGTACTLVDPVRSGYQVAGGGSIQDLTTYEGGLSHTMDATAASFRAYITTTPAAGHSLRYLARGLFKLGSVPTLLISALVKGYNGGALGYVNTMGTVSRDIITRRGPKIIDPTEIDAGSFTTFNALPTSTGIIGLAYRDPKSINILNVLDAIFSSGATWWGYKRSEILFHVERFNGPAASADFNFTQRYIVDIKPQPVAVTIHEVVVRYRHNDVVHSEEQVVAGIKSTLGWQQLTEEWQSQPSTDNSLKTSTSVSVTFDTVLQYQADAKTLADFLLELLKGPKVGYSLDVTRLGLLAVIGQTCTIAVTLQKGANYRLVMDGSKKYSIITIADNRSDGLVRLDVWGDR